jgi:Putative Flp pilus-assembly TadE/G-like
MAALAIDVTTLYVNRNQAEEAVDAAALAGAKAFVSSGFTSGNVSSSTARTLATNEALSVGQQSIVAGTQVTAAELTVTFPQITQSNPIISVVFSRSGIPSFFANIWGVRSTSLSANAKAEAYNPSGHSAPIQVAGVKPWLLANCDPSNASPANPNCPGAAYFVDPTTGAIQNSGSFMGQTINLYFAPNRNAVTLSPGQFYPLDIPETPPTPFCAASSQTGCGNTPGIYYDGIACFNPTTFTCGQTVNGPADPVWIDGRFHTGALQPRTDQGTQCLIHSSATTAAPPLDCGGGPYEQDCFVVSGPGNPILMTPGTANPDGSLSGADYISRSDSVITVPLFNGSNLCPANPCTGIQQTAPATIVGFLQLGIQADVSNPTNQVQAVILNASGCNSTPSGTAISGGNVSPIPVRLIQGP